MGITRFSYDLLPALMAVCWLVLLSGVMFGGVFLSLVASTTALVRHNLPHSQWARVISVFTIVLLRAKLWGRRWWPAVAATVLRHFAIRRKISAL